MKAKLLTLAALAAMFVGGMTWTNTAEARPWRGYYGGGYYGGGYVAGPVVRYRPAVVAPYRYAAPYRYYGPARYGYGYPRYYSPGVYFGAGPVGVYVQ